MSIWLEGAEKYRLPARGQFRIGRHAGSDLVIPTREASRHHAIIECQPHAAWLLDLGSRNGTWLNRSKVTRPVQLRDGDEIRVATLRWRFRQDCPPKTSAKDEDSVFEQTTLLAEDLFVPSEHGAVLLDAMHRVQSKSAEAQRMLIEFFNFAADNPEVPAEVRQWLAHPRTNRTSLVLQAGDQRLTIRLAPAGEDYRVLYLTRESYALSERMLSPFRLTGRELEVLRWIVAGKRNEDIAVILDIGVRTVEKHVERVYGKLGVESRSAAVKTVLQQLSGDWPAL